MSNTSRKDTHKKRNFPLFRIALLIKFGLLLVLVGGYYYFFAQQSEVSYFQIENPIVYQGEIYQKSAVINNGQLYLPFQFILDHLDSGVTYDEHSESVIIISDENILRFPKEQLEKYVNEQAFEIEVETLITENQELYVEIEQLENIYPIEYILDANLPSVVITMDGDARDIGYVKDTAKQRELRLKTDTSYFSNFYDQVVHNEQLIIEAKVEDYYLVRNQKGIAGFMKQDLLENIETEVVSIYREQPFGN